MTLSFEQISPEPSYAGGVYQPQEDSLLLADCLRLVPQIIGGRVLDLCTGSGVLRGRLRIREPRRSRPWTPRNSR